MNRLVWTILVSLLILELVAQPATASSKPSWAKEGVYFVYGFLRIEVPIYEEELESTINRWRYADVRDYGLNVLEIKLTHVDENGATGRLIEYSGKMFTPIPGGQTVSCRWNDHCEPFPFYVNRGSELLKPEVRESCGGDTCHLWIRELRETSIATRFGVLDVYEVIVRNEVVKRLDNETERAELLRGVSRLHKSTGILIEAIGMERLTCPSGKDCWRATAFFLLETNVPLEGRPLMPVQTTPQTTSTPVTTPLTTQPTPIRAGTEIPGTTPLATAEQPTMPAPFAGVLIPAIAVVVVAVALIAVFKYLRK